LQEITLKLQNRNIEKIAARAEKGILE